MTDLWIKNEKVIGVEAANIKVVSVSVLPVTIKSNRLGKPSHF